MRIRYLITLACLGIAADAGVLYGPGPVVVAAGLLLALGLPGAALTAALFRDPAALTAVERAVLIPALSLAALVLGGLAAWAGGRPLDRDTWLGVAAMITFISLVVAVVRRSPAPPVPAAPPTPTPTPAPATAQVRVKLPTANDPTLILPVFLDRAGVFVAEPSRWQRPAGRRIAQVLLPLTVAALLLGGAGWLSFATSRSTHDVAVTALSATPPTIDPYGQRDVQVTATGLPADSAAFSVVVTAPDGKPASRHPVTADDEGVWTSRLRLPGTQRMTIGLYRAGEATAYRTVIVAAG